MTETTGSNKRRTFRDKWKGFDEKATRFFRKYGPIFFVGLSVFFLAASTIWSIADSTDKAIQSLLLAGLMLGYAVVLPFLSKHKESESRDESE